MHIFQRVLKNPTSKIIFSILWGFGLATLFRQACKGRGCIIFRAPQPKHVVGKTFKVGDQCYQYTPRVVNCTGAQNIVPPEQFFCTR
jgi:hypothetical protein